VSLGLEEHITFILCVGVMAGPTDKWQRDLTAII